MFTAVSWIWRPVSLIWHISGLCFRADLKTANNRSFAMSQELAQDEHEADDAEDFEFDTLENREGHQPINQGEDDDDEEDERKRFGRTRGAKGEVGDENTVFALDDSDEEGSDNEGRAGHKGRKSGEYRDADDGSDEEGGEKEGLKKRD